MTQIDRYILALFLRTVTVCFLSLSGIFIVFHAFTNLNDLVDLAAVRGTSLTAVMASYYGPYLLLLFDWTGAIIALMALLFVVGWLRRTGELTATLAAGVSHGRILRSMIWATLLIVSVQLVSREFVLPTMREALSLTSDLTGDAPKPILKTYDEVQGILLDGESIRPRSRSIKKPNFNLYGDYGDFGETLVAESAQWLPADDQHGEGYLLSGVRQPEGIDSLVSEGLGDRLVLMTSRDQPWLASGECFVATTINTEILQTDSRTTKLCSSATLFHRLRNPAVHNSMATKVVLHERLMRPPLDYSLFLLGLPLVVNRKDRNLFMMIGAAIGTVLIFFILKTVGTTLGSGGYALSPPVAAWMPLIVLGPIAYMRLREVETV